MSTPIFSADKAWRMVTHLWMEMQPPSLKILTNFLGSLPAVSTTLMPALTMACAYAS